MPHPVPARRWEWLKEPCDSQGRPPSHPDHDPTTLLIPASAWTSHLKGADAQYWRIKRDGCAHMVLFFQEGGEAHKAAARQMQCTAASRLAATSVAS